MKNWSIGIGVCVLAVLGLIAVPAMAQTNLLLNGSFESGASPILYPDSTVLPPGGMGTIPDSWTLTRINSHDPNGWQFGRSLYLVDGAHGDPGVTAHTGSRYLFSDARWWYDQGLAEQTVTVAPGTYTLELSFYGLVYDTSGFVGHISGEIIVNGETVAAGHLANYNDGMITYTKVTATWSGQVADNGSGNGAITVRFSTTANGLGGASYCCLALDDVKLNSYSCGTQQGVTDISPNVVDFTTVSAQATITISGDVYGTGVPGDTLELDTTGANRVYEFDTGDGIHWSSKVAVDVSAGVDKVNAKAKLIAAINGDTGAVCTAADGGGDNVLLTWKGNGGNGAINTNLYDHNNPPIGNIAETDFAVPAQPANTITISGPNLSGVTGARLWRSGIEAYETTEWKTGTNLRMQGADLLVDFITNGMNDGFYDVIVEKTGCCPVVITGGLQIQDTSVLPNLLPNPTFEVLIREAHHANDVGNCQMWYGDYLKDPAWNATPADGAHGVWSYWSNSMGWGETPETTTTWQTVPVAASSSVEFTGLLDCNKDPGGSGLSTATVTVYDGLQGGTEIGHMTINQDTVGTYGNWSEVDITGTAGSGQVTVELTTTINAAAGGASAFADRFSLTADPLCSEQLYAQYSYPSGGPHDQDVTVTILGGSQLDTISLAEVKLVFVDALALGDETELEVPAQSIISQSPTKLVVSFPIATSSVPEGLYNLVIEQDNCLAPNLVDMGWVPVNKGARPPAQTKVPPTFVDKYHVYCSNPTEFSSVEPNWSIGEATKQLRIIGTNVIELTAVSLVHIATQTEVPGYDLSTDGDDLLAWFDFSTPPAPNGAYGIKGVRGADGCNDPEAVLPIPDQDPVFRYHAAGSNLLLNGGFEEEGQKGADADYGGTPPSGDGVVARWPMSSLGSVNQPKYNGSPWNPGAPVAGYNYGSVDKGGNGTARIVQTVPVKPGAQVTLTGSIYGFTTNWDTEPADHFVRILDGGDDGEVMDEFVFKSGAYPGFTAITPLTGTPTADTVTVEWGFFQPGGYHTVATHVDELVLTQEPIICSEPYAADADDDGDVDQDDFGYFQICFVSSADGASPTNPPDPFEAHGYDCRCFDVRPEGVPDGTVDDADLTVFEGCMKGAGVAIPGTCGM